MHFSAHQRHALPALLAPLPLGGRGWRGRSLSRVRVVMWHAPSPAALMRGYPLPAARGEGLEAP